MKAYWCCSPAQSGLPLILAVMLTHGSSGLLGQFLKFPCQACPQLWVLYMLVRVAAQSGMANLNSAFTDRCCTLTLPSLP